MSAQIVRTNGVVTIHELLGSGDPERIEAMLGMYARLFPKYEHYVARMRRRSQFGNEHRPGHVLHYWLVEVNGKPAGLRTFRYVRGRHCGLAHALAVEPEFRNVVVNGKKLAVYMIYECLAQVLCDAQERGDAAPLGMVNEVEPDRLMEHYTRNGLLKLPLKYVEPIFPPESAGKPRSDELAQVNFSPMFMGFLPNPEAGIIKYTSGMISEFVRAFLVDHYGLPETHPVVREVLDTIRIEE